MEKQASAGQETSHNKKFSIHTKKKKRKYTHICLEEENRNIHRTRLPRSIALKKGTICNFRWNNCQEAGIKKRKKRKKETTTTKTKTAKQGAEKPCPRRRRK